MVGRSRVRIPAVSTLIAFESAGRLGNFSRAAEELQTSQSAISRHIAKLEEQLSTRVFHRSRTGVSLTETGSDLYDAVAAGLKTIDSAIVRAGEACDEEHLSIACSHDAWQFVFMPRLDALQEFVGENFPIRFTLYPQDSRHVPLDPDADVVFTWDASGAGPDTLTIPEAVRPVCSPRYAEANPEVFEGPAGGWSGLTLLDFSIPDGGWASWADWFGIAGQPDPMPRIVDLDSYGDILRAVAVGKGVALGWRYCVERYIEAGALVPLGDDFIEFDNFFCGLLTEKGRKRPAARSCLGFIDAAIGT